MADYYLSNKHPDISWQALQYFNLYRFLITFLFVALIWAGHLPQPLGIYDRDLFSIVAHIYLAFSIAIAFVIRFQIPRYNLQVAGQVLIDIAAISMMMYASAGLSSGFGMLLVIAVAGGSILSAGRIAILFAAIAALVVLGQEVYVQLSRYYPPPNYTHAGLLGITFFITAILGNILSARVEKSEALAKERAVDLESMARLNENIVQRMHSGIIVLDYEFRIRLINESARTLLGLERKIYHEPLINIAPELSVKFNEWLHHESNRTFIIKPDRSELDVQVSFTRLKPDTKFETLIFLEDVASLRQRAQHMKLASLGRLAASIAHEVRNPLGAISHAGQLLSESESVNGEDNRLIQIIMEQTYRVNAIIENVQQISRRGSATPKQFQIKLWLDEFIREFILYQQLVPEAISYLIEPEDMNICMDPSQLHQVLWNLSENAIRYSNGLPFIEFRCGIRKETERPYLDVIDHGPGISDEVVEHLFEPFFTKNSTGSGLGLYISRELCEANQASLSLHSNSSNGCCFRIHFPHVERQQN
ncbi:MAG: hypothetical protein HY356_04185 [Gammaproteobacteria bacterium]|nr:hypothetical protein [Gammaproteobacteria bacterium]